MTTANFWRIWLCTKLVSVSFCMLCCLPAGLHAQAGPQMQFVKIVPYAPGAYAAPVRFGPGEIIGLRITGPVAQDAGLQIQGLVNHDPAGAYAPAAGG